MKIYFRIYQFILRVCSYFQNFRTPIILSGENVYRDIVNVLTKEKPVLIVTEKTISELGLIDELLNTLKRNHISYILYDGVLPNPSIHCVQKAVLKYRETHCYEIIAIGGGSSIDCAKIVAAQIAKPNLQIERMGGLLKVRTKLVPIIAIPTTAGTGSETTIAAVITDEEKQEKYAISDMCLIPEYAAMIPTLTASLPKHITATTGLDALTHAIESYIGNANTKQTKVDALEAISLIYQYLPIAYDEPNNILAREKMLFASFYAGKAFTRGYVGNIHAMAHAVGGVYHVPHGLANAIILPFVLREYGNKIHRQLSEICDILHLCDSAENKSYKSEIVLAWIENMNETMKIPKTISEIKYADIDVLVDRAYHESNPLYPVPVIFSKDTFRKMFIILKGDQNAKYYTNC